MPRTIPKYPRKRPAGSFSRLVVEIPNDEIRLVDLWGVSAGMPSRTAAIRHLIQQGLEAEKTEEAKPGSTPSSVSE